MNKLLYLLLAILFIWNIFLTIELTNQSLSHKNNHDQVVIENVVNGFSTDLTRIVPNIQSSIVTIKTENSSASGVIVRQIENTIYIVSNYHTIENSNNLNIVLDNFTTLKAELVGYDLQSDVAVLKTNSKYKVQPITYGNSSILNNGEFVLAIGSPISNDYRGSISFGMVSEANRVVEVMVNNHNYYVNMIQSDITLNSGNSGGALVNMQGELVGLNTMSLELADAKDMSFSIPSNELKLIVNEIIENGKATKVNLGLKVYPLAKMANYQKSSLNIALDQIDGLYVMSAKGDFFGSYLGIKEGDIILEINDKTINSIDDYINEEYQVLDKINIKILRNNVNLLLEGVINTDD